MKFKAFVAVLVAAFFVAGCLKDTKTLAQAIVPKPKPDTAKLEKELAASKRQFACDQAAKSGARDFSVKWRDSGETKKKAASMAAFWMELCKADMQQPDAKSQ